MAFIFFLGTIRRFRLGWNWNRCCPLLSSATQPRPQCLRRIRNSSTGARRSCSKNAMFCRWSRCRNISASAKRFATGYRHDGANGASPMCGSILLSPASRTLTTQTERQLLPLNHSLCPPEPSHELPNKIANGGTAHHLCVRLGGCLCRDALHPGRV